MRNLKIPGLFFFFFIAPSIHCGQCLIFFFFFCNFKNFQTWRYSFVHFIYINKMYLLMWCIHSPRSICMAFCHQGQPKCDLLKIRWFFWLPSKVLDVFLISSKPVFVKNWSLLVVFSCAPSNKALLRVEKEIAQMLAISNEIFFFFLGLICEAKKKSYFFFSSWVLCKDLKKKKKSSNIPLKYFLFNFEKTKKVMFW